MSLKMSLTKKLGLMVGTIGLAGIIGCGSSKEEYRGHIPKYEVTTRIHKKMVNI